MGAVMATGGVAVMAH